MAGKYIPLSVSVTVLGIMMGVIIVTNIFLILALTIRKRVRTVTNAYIVSLSVADLMVGLLVTLTLLTHIGIPLEKEWCLSASYIEIATFAAGILSLLAITIDRFLSVTWPVEYKPSLKQALKIILAVWIISFIYGSRIFIQDVISSDINKISYNETIQLYNTDDLFCVFFVESGSKNAYFRLLDFLCLFILPILAMTFMNATIIFKLKGQPNYTATQIRRKTRVAQMLIACNFAFFICWFPFYLQEITHDFDTDISPEGERMYVIARFVCLVLALFNSVFNAVIYGYFNNNFRKEVTSLWTHMKTKSRRKLVITPSLSLSHSDLS